MPPPTFNSMSSQEESVLCSIGARWVVACKSYPSTATALVEQQRQLSVVAQQAGPLRVPPSKGSC